VNQRDPTTLLERLRRNNSPDIVPIIIQTTTLLTKKRAYHVFGFRRAAANLLLETGHASLAYLISRDSLLMNPQDTASARLMLRASIELWDDELIMSAADTVYELPSNISAGHVVSAAVRQDRIEEARNFILRYQKQLDPMGHRFRVNIPFYHDEDMDATVAACEATPDSYRNAAEMVLHHAVALARMCLKRAEERRVLPTPLACNNQLDRILNLTPESGIHVKQQIKILPRFDGGDRQNIRLHDAVLLQDVLRGCRQSKRLDPQIIGGHFILGPGK